MNLSDSKYYFNRELSWLEFNNRVLEEAYDKTNPLFERLKFLAITASNLDEFFMIRVSGLHSQVNSKYSKKDISGKTPKEQLEDIWHKTYEMTVRQYNCLKRSIMPGLEKAGLYFSKFKELDSKQKVYVEKYFDEVTNSYK